MKSSAARWVATGIVAAAFAVAGYALVVGPTIDDIFSNVSNDACERFASGEPDRDDPDCQSDPWTGVKHVEAWDREHPAGMEDYRRWAGENALGVAALTVAVVMGVPTLYFAWHGWGQPLQRRRDHGPT